MPLKELSLSEQIEILRKLDDEEKLYEKNVALASHDTYALKHKYNVLKEPEPISSIYSAISQQPTVEAIKKLDQTKKKCIKAEGLFCKISSFNTMVDSKSTFFISFNTQN